MLKPKHIGWFFLRFLLVLILLTMVPWPGLQKGYAAVFRAGVNLVFGTFGSQGRVRVEPLDIPDPERDTKFTLENTLTGGRKTIGGSSLTQGYMPTAFMVALILGTPMPWRRLWRALVWGLLLISAFVGFRVFLFLLSVFGGEGGPAFIELGVFWRGCLQFLIWALVTSYAGWYVVPLPLWFFLTFRLSDWTVPRALGPDAPKA